MATINFLYRSTRSSANLVLRLLFTHNETNFVFGANTNLEVSKDYWNNCHKKPQKDIKIKNLQIDVSNELNKIENHILNSFKSVSIDLINKEWLQTEIDNFYNPPQKAEILPQELLKYFDYFIECKKNEVSIGSLKKYNVSKRLLQRFQLDNKKIIYIIDVNDSFRKNFENYCIKNLYAPNTISKDLRIIKTVCFHAKFNGITTSHQLEKIKATYQKIDKIYLTFDELAQIEKTQYNDSLNNAKDWLIISCYTGQRVSDFMKFTNDKVRIENGKQLIEFTQQKTGKIMTVPLHPKVIEILNARNGMFPYAISDQKYNDYIKQVCRIAKLTEKIKGSKKLETAPKSGLFRKESGVFEKCELVTSHIGRRSFATNFYGKIPTTYLIYVTGHSTESMFLNYIGKSNKDLAMELINYF